MHKETVMLPVKGIFPETKFHQENNEIRIKIARYKQLINEDSVMKANLWRKQKKWEAAILWCILIWRVTENSSQRASLPI